MKVVAFLLFTSFSLTLFGGTATPDSISYFMKDGQRIIIYEVEAGESLYGISQKYDVAVDEILALNPSIENKQIREGQIIKIPGRGTTQQAEKISTNKIKIHNVKRGETLYAISQKYDVSVSSILKANKRLKADKLAAGQKINIPLSKGSTKEGDQKSNTAQSSPEGKADKEEKPVYAFPTKTDKKKDNQDPNIYHEVKPGETMYGISRKYKVKVTQLLDWNSKENFSIDVGEKLIVGKRKPGEKPAKKGPSETTASTQKPKDTTTKKHGETGEFLASDGDQNPGPSNPPRAEVEQPAHPKEESQVNEDYQPRETLISLEYKEHLSTEEYTEQSEKTIAKWMKNVDGYPLKNGYFALHKSLPIGTIIKVTNPVNRRIVFAKVIGHLPNAGENKDIQIKLPKAASKELKAFDEISMLQISYLKERNGQ